MAVVPKFFFFPVSKFAMDCLGKIRLDNLWEKGKNIDLS